MMRTGVVSNIGNRKASNYPVGLAPSGGLAAFSFMKDFINSPTIYDTAGRAGTFVRVTPATITDQDLKVNAVLSGEARFGGFRRVRNLLTSTEGVLSGSWVLVNATKTSGISDPFGGTQATTVTPSINTGYITSSAMVAGDFNGRTMVGSVWLRSDEPNKAMQVYVAKNGDVTPGFGPFAINLSTTWKRYSFGGTVSVATTTVGLILQSLSSTNTFQMYGAQLEDVTGQTNQNPAEYVSVGVLSAPYQGANVDGVKYFNTLNGNTVTANVVTEATGPNINGNSNFGAFPGLSGAIINTPDSVAASITGDIDIQVMANLVDWTPAAINYLIVKSNSTGTQRSYGFGVNIAGTLVFFRSTDGTGGTITVSVSSVANTFTDGTTGWVRVTRQQSSGDVKFYTSPDGITWTQLGTTKSNAPGVATFDSTSTVDVGATDGGLASFLTGKVYRAKIYNGINGTLAVDFNPNSWTSGATWVSATGETWTINGSARVQAVSLGGYLPEPAATNLCLQSETFDAGAWALSNATISANATVAPNGTLTADKIQETAAAGVHAAVQAIAKAASAILYTAFCYVKAAERGFAYVQITDGGGNGVFASWNLATGAIVTAATNAGTFTTAAAIAGEAAANGFWKLSISGTSNAAVNVSVLVSPSVNGTDASNYAGSAGSGIYAWGAQLVTGNQLGLINSYIPTTTVSVTRNADVLTWATTGWLNAAAGTLYAEYFQAAGAAAGTQSVVGIHDGTPNNYVMVYRNTSTDATFGVSSGGVAQAVLTVAVTAGQVTKAVGIYQANDFAGFANNATMGTDGAGTIPTITTLSIGTITGNQTGHYVRKVGYMPARAASAQAQALTL